MQITAIEPYYDVGTATLSTANRNMTGQGGTQWLANVQPGDQVYGADGRMGGVVETVNTNTSITLTKNWRGANQSAGVYTIFRVSDSVRVENFSQRLLNLLLGGNLTALGDLTLAANKGIHGTGAGALGTHDLSTFMRGVLASMNAGAARNALELGGFATLNPGAFGWGTDNASVNIPNDNANTLTISGIWRTTSSTIGIPINVTGQLLHMGQSQNVAAQIWLATGAGNTRIFRRTRSTANAWTDWVEFGHPLLGLVSQTGGVPTGAIIEEGSTANGMYRRLAGGRQECWHTINLGPASEGSGTNTNPYITTSSSWSFPASFIAPPVVSLAGRRPSGTSSQRTMYGAYSQNNPSTSSLGGIKAIAAQQNSDDIFVDLIAIGRWHA